jgi:hypothetical protein
VYAADFVHFLRGYVTRLFDQGYTVKMTLTGPEITQEAIRERVERAPVADLFDGTQFNQKIQDGACSAAVHCSQLQARSRILRRLP